VITVIVPSYNHEKHLMECLESIHQQTFKEFQWIVIDDGSKDNSPKILKEYQRKYNYTLILQSNKGLANTLNYVIKEYAIGEYIAVCASDDLWLPDKLQKQIELMQENPMYAMCYGRAHYIDQSSKLLKIDLKTRYKGGYIFEDIFLQKFHPPVNYLIKKNVIEEVGYYKPNVIGEDFYMNCHISLKYQVGYVNDYLGYYRVVEIGLKRDPYKSLCDLRNTIEDFHDNPLYREARVVLHYKFASMLVHYTKYKFLSLKYLISSLSKFDIYQLMKYFMYLFFRWNAVKN
jgi:alpha-1,3-rhamnosyltransferase